MYALHNAVDLIGCITTTGDLDEEMGEEVLDIYGLEDAEASLEDPAVAAALATPLGVSEIRFLPNGEAKTPIVWKPAADATHADLGRLTAVFVDLFALAAYHEGGIATLEDAETEQDDGPEAFEPNDLDWFRTQDVTGWQAVRDWHTNAYIVNGQLDTEEDGVATIILGSES